MRSSSSCPVTGLGGLVESTIDFNVLFAVVILCATTTHWLTFEIAQIGPLPCLFALTILGVFFGRHRVPSSGPENAVEELTRALNLAGVGPWERELRTNTLRVSEMAVRLLGIGVESGSGSFEDFLGVVHPDDRQRVIDSMNECAFGGAGLITEFRMVMPDGSHRWLAARGGVINDAHGEPEFLAGIFEDVTLHKQAHANLVERDLLYERLAENVPGIVYQMIRYPDGSRVVPYISNRVEEVFGVTRDQVYDDANLLIEAIHPDDREEKEDSAGQAMANLTHFDWTGRIMRPDGGVRWIHALCRPTQLPGGAIHWDGVMLDVTDVKAAELDHIETKNRLAWLLRSSPIVIYSCDGRSPYPITYISDNAGELLGIPVEECLADPHYLQKRIHPEEADAALRALEDLPVLGPTSIEYRILVASGEYRWVRDELRHVVDGESIAIVGTIVDVTERRTAQDALRLSDERFLAMSNASPLGVLLTDTDGAIIYVNRKLEELTGVAQERLFGWQFFDLVHKEDTVRVREGFTSSVAERSELSVQCRLQRRGHGTIWCSIKTAPMFDGSQLVGFVGTVEDVTERFELEMQSEQSRIEAERANQAKSAFLTRISHELRTPLHAMLGFAQLLQRGVLDDSQKESVDSILGSGHHLLSLIRDVLDIARAESGDLGVQVSPVSLYPVVDETVQMLSALARQNGIHIEVKLEDGDHVSVLADRQRLRQAVINVLSNAIKYNSREGTVTISCDVSADGFAKLAIRDSGSGIPLDKVDRLFTPFDRLGAESTSVEGTGLGLTLTKRLLEAMGGKLELESDEREGTTVYISLRYAGSRQGGRAAVLMHDKQAMPPNDKKTILLIEDNESSIKLMQSVLQNRPHYSLETARSGRAGLEYLTQNAPDLVLLDMNLPDMVGIALLERIKAESAQARTEVIVISATATDRQVEQARQLGAAAYLTKPLDINELLRKVDDALGAATL